MKRLAFLLAPALAASTASTALAQKQDPNASGPTVMNAVKWDVSAPLASIKPLPDIPGTKRIHPPHRVPLDPETNKAYPDPAVQTEAAPGLLAPTLGTTFEGIGAGMAGYTVQNVPPDTTGDVGPNHYIQWVNVHFAIFNKSGSKLYGPARGSTLFTGFGTPCETTNDGDPLAQYDQLADRWVMSQFTLPTGTGPFYQCFAVSVTGDPLGAWYRYAFLWPGGKFNDYGKMGVWPDGYYLGVNLFDNAAGGAFHGAGVAVFDRAKMLNGQAATGQFFHPGNLGALSATPSLFPSDLDGRTPPPAGANNYFLRLQNTAGELGLWKFHVDWTTPASSTFTGPTTIVVPSWTNACGECVPQPGGGVKDLDSLGGRLMYRIAYRNYGSYEAISTNHGVNSPAPIGVRWYEIRNPGGTPTVQHASTYEPDGTSRWMGSIAMDQDGNAGLGYSVSSTSVFPGIRFTGRLRGDGANTLQSETSMTAGGGGTQSRPTPTGDNRWGDYSTISVDPVDDCTFWYTNEYIGATTGSFVWRTRVGSFKFATCGTCPPSGALAAPTVTVTASGSNQLTLSWPAVVGASSYQILRSRSVCAGAMFIRLATEVAGTSFVDTDVVDGQTYAYQVVAVDANNCAGTASTCQSATAAGTCIAPPSFGGAQATSSAPGCGITVRWTSAISNCSGSLGIGYNVYRSTSAPFTPSPSNRIAAGVTGSSYSDNSNLAGTYNYIVRAAETSSGIEDLNEQTVSGFPAQLNTPYTDDFEASAGTAGWTVGAFFGSSGADWRGVQACDPAQSGTKIYRYGATTCPLFYSEANNVALGATPAQAIPVGATKVRFNFSARWDFNTSEGFLFTLGNGSGSFLFFSVPPLISGPSYSGTTGACTGADGQSRGVWTGVQSTMTPFVIDLDAACNSLFSITTGCATRTIQPGFIPVTGACGGSNTGLFLDDVSITYDSSCSAAGIADPVQFLTARATGAAGATSGEVKVEWLNPAAGAYSSTRILRKAGSFPTSATDGTILGNFVGSLGSKGTVTDSSLSTGVAFFYAAYVNGGSGFSSGKFVSARPEDTTTLPTKWIYSTGASTLGTPAFDSAVYAVSNDRVVHSMNGNAAGGDWPATWTPRILNGPVQDRFSVPTLGGNKQLFVSSQDGRIYGINADSGAQLWQSVAVEQYFQASPAGYFTTYGGTLGVDILLAGTRNPSTDNEFYAINAGTGATLGTPFNNGGGATGFGIVSEHPSVDYAAKKVYFATRRKVDCSQQAVWCLDFTAAGITGACSGFTHGDLSTLGDIDGTVIVFGGRIFLGGNNGTAYVLNAATGQIVTSLALADGPVKGFIFPSFSSLPMTMYLATSTNVWSLTLTPGLALTTNWSVAATSPSTPFLGGAVAQTLIFGTGNGRLVELSNLAAGAPTQKSIQLGAGTSAAGAPTRDDRINLAYVGTDSGAIYAVSLPLP